VGAASKIVIAALIGVFALVIELVHVWHVWPQTPSTTRVACYLLFPEAAFGIPNFDLELGKYSRFVEQIIAEDSVMVESLQNAAGSKFFEPGPMAPLEEALHHMEKHYIDLMTG